MYILYIYIYIHIYGLAEVHGEPNGLDHVREAQRPGPVAPRVALALAAADLLDRLNTNIVYHIILICMCIYIYIL